MSWRIISSGMEKAGEANELFRSKEPVYMQMSLGGKGQGNRNAANS